VADALACPPGLHQSGRAFGDQKCADFGRPGPAPRAGVISSPHDSAEVMGAPRRRSGGGAGRSMWSGRRATVARHRPPRASGAARRLQPPALRQPGRAEGRAARRRPARHIRQHEPLHRAGRGARGEPGKRPQHPRRAAADDALAGRTLHPVRPRRRDDRDRAGQSSASIRRLPSPTAGPSPRRT
jgi:hypothetical protein